MGRWILDHNKPAKAALERVLLSFGVGFELPGFKKAYFDALRENAHAIAFYRRFGATETGADDTNVCFEYGREQFMDDRDSYIEILKTGTGKTDDPE